MSFGYQLLIALVGGPILGVIIAKLLGIPLLPIPQDFRTIKPVEHAPDVRPASFANNKINYNASVGMTSGFSNCVQIFSEPLIYPIGRPPPKWGPGARIPARHPSEYKYVQE